MTDNPSGSDAEPNTPDDPSRNPVHRVDEGDEPRRPSELPSRTSEVKRQWRDRSHRSRTSAQRLADRPQVDARRTEAALEELAGVKAVCTYLSRSPEPDTLELARGLVAAGIRVLAPVLTDGRGHGLGHPAWAWFTPEDVRPGLWSIPEPCGPLLPAESIKQCDVILCSALWVDRRGYRVGVGGGWYDRVLEDRRTGAPVWAVVDDCEIVDEVPRQPWDLPVDAAFTQTGLHPLG